MRSLKYVLCACAISLAGRAEAKTLQVSGGRQAFCVVVDGTGLHAGSTCAKGSDPKQTAIIGIPFTDADVTIETHRLSGSVLAAHVKIATAASTFEAVAVGRASEPEIIFSGVTGFSQGEAGERRGTGIQWLGDKKDTLAMGDLREEITLSVSEPTLLRPEIYNPASGKFYAASFLRIPSEIMKSVTEVEARPVPALRRSLADLLVLGGSSSGNAAEITTDHETSEWVEERPGSGRGEFVVLRTATEIPLTALTLLLAPAKGTTPPKSLYLVMDDRAVHVTLPAPEQRGWFRVSFDHPVTTSRIAIVLDEASASGNVLVGLMSVSAESVFDKSEMPLADVIGDALSNRPSSEAATAFALRARDRSQVLSTLSLALPNLDREGVLRAMSIAGSDACSTGDFLVRAVVRTNGDARVVDRLARCDRKKILSALVTHLIEGEAGARAALRGLISRSLSHEPAEFWATYHSTKDPRTKFELMRAVGDHLPQSDDELIAKEFTALKGERERYQLLPVVAGRAGTGRPLMNALLSTVIATEPSPMVRMRAAELSAHMDGVKPTLVRALKDPEPRVREMAARSLIDLAPDQASILEAFEAEKWSFVRVELIAILQAGHYFQTSAGKELLDHLVNENSPSVRLVAESIKKGPAVRPATPPTDPRLP